MNRDCVPKSPLAPDLPYPLHRRGSERGNHPDDDYSIDNVTIMNLRLPHGKISTR